MIYKYFIRKFGFIKFFILFCILILSFWLRLYNFTVWPRHGATFDEFAWTWLGINLIQKGVPMSWSRHPQYKDVKIIKYQGAVFSIVKPYLEHPPLFGLVAGSFAILNGAKDMYDVTLDKMRPLAIFLGVSSVLAIFLLVKSLYGVNTALLASILYGIIPTIVVGSRIVQNENFLIPLWLLSLYFLSKYFQTNRKGWRNSAIVIAALLPLAKVPWVAVSLSLCMVLGYKGKWKDVLLVTIATCLVFLFFIVYGIYFDKEIFFGLWKLQLARYDMNFIGIYSLFTKPLLVDRFFLDGWIYFGFFSIMLLLQNFKKHIYIIFSFLAYLLIFVFIIPDEPEHGWYRYPFYPFLIIALSLFIKEYFSKNNLLTFIFFIFTALPLLQYTWVATFGFSYFYYRFVLICFALTLTPLFFKDIRIIKSIKFISYGLFMVLMFLNIWSVLIYNEQ